MSLLSHMTAHPSTSLHNPFRTYSNYIYPKTVEDIFVWAQWFWDRNAKYRTALQKVVSYFVSGVTVTQDTEFGEVDSDAVAECHDLLVDRYGLLELVNNLGLELAGMGNVFVSCEYIFDRQLLCPTPDCNWMMRLKALTKNVDYTWCGDHFEGICPQCRRKVTWMIKDQQVTSGDVKKVRFVFRNPSDMAVQFNPLTGDYKYYYKMPQDIKNAIIRGDNVFIESSPEVFLKAASTNSFIEFPEDSFFSMRTHTLTALDKLYRGWGVPLFMTSFDNFIRLQHLDKFNEAVTMDYIAPTRLICPQPGNMKAGLDDPNRMPISGAMFSGFIKDALRRVKENPTTWIVSPVPVQYQMLGGEAKQLAPVDLMEWYTTQILSDMGIPQEFRQTTFQTVAPSMGMRMFERQWIHFAKALSEATTWMAERICDAHNVEDMHATLDVTSFVEDDMNKQVLLQLMQSGMISKTATLKRFGVDFTEDAKQRVQEQKKEEEIAMGMQTDAEGAEMVRSVLPPDASVGIGQAQANIDMMQQQAAQAQGGEAPMAPGAPMPPAGPAGAMPPMPFNTGNSESASVDMLYQQAQDLAQQLYNQPPNIRRQQLVQLKSTNPQMHSFVTQFLKDMKQQVASDAVAQSQMPQG